MEHNIEEILNEAIDMLLAGTPMQDVLAAYPDDAGRIAPALREAQMLQRSAPQSTPDPTARGEARERMLAILEETRRKADEFKTPPVAISGQTGTGRGSLARFMKRPASFRAAAVAGSIALVGVLGVGAAAATGNAPEPVREFFGASSAALRVEFDGVIVATDATAMTLDVDVDVAGDVRTVHVVDSTELSRGGDSIAFDVFAAGDPVEVKGALQPDDTIVASRVHLEDDVDEPDADQTIDGDDDGNDDDNDDSGSDNAGHDDADDSGPGSADDDGEAHEDAGPGSDDDDLDDDDSNPGNVDDDAEDDDSGPGSIDDDSADTDDDVDDDSGSDIESGDDSDDGSGSGSDDEPNHD